ncbi:MAG: ketopantoate reductase family protein [Propionicimonas sp.]
MPRIHVVGLGAVGAAYASRFAEAGADLRVVVDPARADRYRSTPTVVNGRAYAFAVLDDHTPADLAIVAVKHAQLDEAIALLRPSIGESTVVLSLLNGISSESRLRAGLPGARVPYAISVGIDAVRTGREIHYSSLGCIVFGDAGNPEPPAADLSRVAGMLDSAGISHHIPADMLHELWWKFLINVGVNQVSAIIRAPYRVLQDRDQPARQVMIAAQREVIAVANASGIALSESDLDRWLEVLDQLDPDNYTSMAQDALAGRPSEVDIFAGELIELGRRTGVPVPVNTTLYGLLKGVEAQPNTIM